MANWFYTFEWREIILLSASPHTFSDNCTSRTRMLFWDNWGPNELLIPVLLYFWHSCIPINLWIIHPIVRHAFQNKDFLLYLLNIPNIFLLFRENFLYSFIYNSTGTKLMRQIWLKMLQTSAISIKKLQLKI